MRFAVIYSALLACGLGVFAAPSAARLSKPSNPGLESAGAPETPPQLKYAFTAKIDWDLNNVSNVWLLHCYWYDAEGQRFGEIVRSTDDGVIPPGTNYLELLIYYVVKLEDGYWAYVRHTGGAILRKTQNGVVRVETDSPKYKWMTLIDFVGPGSFNGTEIMTVHHYFPNVLCHCADCRKITGSTYSTNVIVPGDGFSVIKGTPKTYCKRADSGKTMTSNFCGDCGSTLWREGETFGDARIIKAGVLDDAGALNDAKPAAELYAVNRVRGFLRWPKLNKSRR
ncbi:MAG: hypothetical protein Q9209_006647 [Squamulea sp. 1 TL-2023]